MSDPLMPAWPPQLDHIHDAPVESIELCSRFGNDRAIVMRLAAADLRLPGWNNTPLTITFIDPVCSADFVGRSEREVIDAIYLGNDQWHRQAAKAHGGGPPCALRVILHSGSRLDVVCRAVLIQQTPAPR